MKLREGLKQLEHGLWGIGSIPQPVMGTTRDQQGATVGILKPYSFVINELLL